MAKGKNATIKNGSVDEENGHVEYELEEEVIEKVKTLELMQLVGRMNRAWMKGGCQSEDIMKEVQELMKLHQRYSSTSKNAVLKSIERTIRFASAGGEALKPIATAADKLLQHAQKICGSGISDKQMRQTFEKYNKLYPKATDI